MTWAKTSDDVQRIEQTVRFNLGRTINAAHDVRGRLLAKALHICQFANVAPQVVEVGIFAHPTEVDELCQGLFGDTVDVHTLFRYKAGKLLQLLGRAFCIRTMQGLRATGLTDANLRLSVTDGTFVGNLQRPFRPLHLNHLRNNLVGFDDTDFCTLGPNPQSFALTDVAERGTLDGCSFQFDGLEDGNRRDGAGCARPFYLLQNGVGCFILPVWA